MLNVLLIDDNDDEHVLIPRFLGSDLGCHFFGAKSIPEAEDILVLHKIGLILLDLYIPGPGKDGFVFLMKLKTRPQYRDIPVVLLSNTVSERDREVALKLGAATFLSKMDFLFRNRDAFVEKIKAVLAGHRDTP